MPYLNDDLDCCGLREITDLSDNPNARDNFEELLEAMEEDNKWRHAVFSEAGEEAHYGQDFAAFIKKERLGTVVKTRALANPNSGNLLRAYLWTVNWTAVKRYAKKHRPIIFHMWED